VNQSTADGLAIRFMNRGGFRESQWINLAPGVTVLTGRNNVGKSRVLRSISNLAGVFTGGGAQPVPEVRLVTENFQVEGDIEGSPAPARWVATQTGQLSFEAQWTTAGGNWLLTNSRQPQAGQTNFGSQPPVIAAQIGNLPLRTEVLGVFQTTVYFQPQRVPETVAGTNPESVPNPDASNLGRVIYYHRGHETSTMAQMDRLIADMFPEIDRILAGPSGLNQITVSVHDRYADQNVPLSEVGTGLTQLLHLIASVLLMQPGRTMLIEEPTAYLHPAAERLLASFIRAHPEHAYVISTHSPIFISALEPDRVVLVRRDATGIDVSPVIGTDVTMRQVLQELGIQPGDLALSERILFVEGVADLAIYPVLLAKLGLDPESHSCALIQLQGFGASRSVRDTMNQLSEHIHVKHLVLLDGDQASNVGDVPNLAYLPVPDVENLFLREPQAVRDGMAQVWEQAHGEALALTGLWDVGEVDKFIRKHAAGNPKVKGSKVLTDLAHELGFDYRKPVHGPAIARHVGPEAISDLKPLFAGLFARRND
jgi:energy-coupling factor transporter ATP-binding protein EcfA2